MIIENLDRYNIYHFFIDEFVTASEILEAWDNDDEIVLNEYKAYGKDGLYIGIFPGKGRNFIEDPYFKASWNSNLERNTARLSMSKGEYIIHYNNTPIITNGVAKDITKALKSNVPSKRQEEIKAVVKKEVASMDMSPSEKEKLCNTKFNVWDSMLFDVATYESINFVEFRNKFKEIPDYKNMKVPKGINTYDWGSK